MGFAPWTPLIATLLLAILCGCNGTRQTMRIRVSYAGVKMDIVAQTTEKIHE